MTKQIWEWDAWQLMSKEVMSFSPSFGKIAHIAIHSHGTLPFFLMSLRIGEVSRDGCHGYGWRRCLDQKHAFVNADHASGLSFTTGSIPYIAHC